MVPDFNAESGVSAGIEDEGVAPLGGLPSELADLCAELLPSEVDLAVGVLNRQGRYHAVDEFGVVGEIGTDGTDAH